MTKIFTGIGSRETPTHILEMMRKLSKKLVLDGFTLRSGGADGADSAFAQGWNDAYKQNILVPTTEIYLPWENFNSLSSKNPNHKLVTDCTTISEAQALLSEVHPAYQKLSRGALALHTRNIFQVLGGDLKTPSRFVMFYAPVDKGGNPKGGTATAVNLAKKRGIRVYNLIWHENREKVEEYLEGE